MLVSSISSHGHIHCNTFMRSMIYWVGENRDTSHTHPRCILGQGWCTVWGAEGSVRYTRFGSWAVTCRWVSESNSAREWHHEKKQRRNGLPECPPAAFSQDLHWPVRRHPACLAPGYQRWPPHSYTSRVPPTKLFTCPITDLPCTNKDD